MKTIVCQWKTDDNYKSPSLKLAFSFFQMSVPNGTKTQIFQLSGFFSTLDLHLLCISDLEFEFSSLTDQHYHDILFCHFLF